MSGEGLDIVGIGAINLDYIASASSKVGETSVSDLPGLFEWGSEHAVEKILISETLARLGIDGLHPSIGGSSFNVIHALASMGLDLKLGFVGVAGEPPVPGISVKQHLQDHDIDGRYVFSSEDTTGICLSLIEDGERTLFTYPGANTSLGALVEEREDELLDYIASAKVVHVTSLLDDHSAEAMLRLLTNLRNRASTQISFDPGHTWADDPSPTVNAFLRLADYLLVNFREFKLLGGYLPGDSDPVIASRIFEQCGPTCSILVLKHYDRTKLFRLHRGEISVRELQHVPLGSREIEDATGAGDVFAAGLLAGLAATPFQVELGVRLGVDLARAKLRSVGSESYDHFAELTSDFIARRTFPRTTDWQPKVFIGHGRDNCWRAVKDFLEDECDVAVASFESESRGGYGIDDVLMTCLDECSMAVCILTAEDDMGSKTTMRARQNVVHEVGLCQGRYGLERVALLVEEGVEGFSNLYGIVQLRFPRGRVDAVFHELHRMLRREGLAA
jgi:sugar/nucleoside kinase (ribokinase family)